jgi:DNA-binding response OmpR family regulator
VGTERFAAIAAAPPTLDEFGVLRAGSTWVALSLLEERLTRRLLRSFGRVVSRAELLDVGWPAGAPRPALLDTAVCRLRARIEPVGLTIRAIYRHGLVLEQRTSAIQGVAGS